MSKRTRNASPCSGFMNCLFKIVHKLIQDRVGQSDCNSITRPSNPITHFTSTLSNSDMYSSSVHFPLCFIISASELWKRVHYQVHISSPHQPALRKAMECITHFINMFKHQPIRSDRAET
jgi:hypothetical protein